MLGDSADNSSVLTDPRTGLERARVPLGTAPDVDAAVTRARRAAPGWAGRTARHRAGALLAFAEAIEDAAAEFADLERAGTGKPEGDARSEVGEAVDVLRFYAGAVRADLAPASGHRLPGRESWVRWEPLGVVAAIVPWNYPLLMAMWRVAPALATGNTVVLKPAETTPDTAVMLARYAAELLGPGVLEVVTGDRATGRHLVGAEVDGIAFTGSPAAGLEIASRAGLRRVSLELGGNCPVVVLPGAPDYTYDEIVRASVYNAGQSCAAPARVIAVPETYEQTVAGLAEAMAKRQAGRDFGPLNNPDQAARHDRILAASTAGRRFPAEVVVTAEEQGGYWRPGAVLADLAGDDPAVVEEVFAPVLTVQRARDTDDAVRLANGQPYALAGSVWGGAAGPLLAVAGALNCGEAWVNCHLEQTGELPHGGRGRSGHGTDLSVLALAEYQRPKTVTVRLD